NRMMWIFIFIGTLLTGIGLDVMVKEKETMWRYRRLIAITCGVFLLLHILAISGVFDLFLHKDRPDLWLLVLHSLLASIFAAIFLFLIITSKIPARWILPLAAILIVADIYYIDVTWYRNTVNQETLIRQDSNSTSILKFRDSHQNDHAKLMWLQRDSIRKVSSELGMFLRLPIE